MMTLVDSLFLGYSVLTSWERTCAVHRAPAQSRATPARGRVAWVPGSSVAVWTVVRVCIPRADIAPTRHIYEWKTEKIV